MKQPKEFLDLEATPQNIGEALQVSIATWEHKLELAHAGKLYEIRLRSQECALCWLCTDNNRRSVTSALQNCNICPVAKVSGTDSCRHTPFSQVVGSLYDAKIALDKDPLKVCPKQEIKVLIYNINHEITFLKMVAQYQKGIENE